MGIYDRDYERGYGQGGYGGDSYGGGGGGWRPEGQGGGIQLRWPTTTVGWVLLVTIAIYLIELLFRDGQSKEITLQGQTFQILTNPIVEAFHLDSDWYLNPWRIYGLLTYGFLHADDNLLHIVGNMFGFWVFGRELERRFGSREFLLFYLAAIVLGGLAFSLGQTLYGEPGRAIGASAGTTAVIILFALCYPNVRVLFMFVIPMPMWVLGGIIIAGDVFGALGGNEATVAFSAHLGGAAFAFLYYRQQWRLSKWVPEQFSLPSFKRRPKLRVHHDDDQPPDADPMDDQLDRVLEKIQAEGQDSLSRKERRILERASQKYQKRNQ